MKYPKLHSYVLIAVFLSGFNILFSQFITAPSLSTNLGNGPTIASCTSDTLVFTASGDATGTLEYQFFRVRGGVTSELTVRQSASVLATNVFINNDQVVARVWNTSQGDINALTNTITLELTDYPQLISLRSDQVGNVVCNTESVELTASSASTNVLFQFFLNGISVQGPSSVSTTSQSISSAVTATVIVTKNGCQRQTDLFINHLSLTAGTISGGGLICSNNFPEELTSTVLGTVNGSQITASAGVTTYQWESSSDGITWDNILNANLINYTVSELSSSTYFRRKIQRELNGKSCVVTSNSLHVRPVEMPSIVQNSGPISQQEVCPNTQITTVTFSVTGSVTSLSTDLSGTGLRFTGPVNGVYTLSGTPTQS